MKPQTEPERIATRAVAKQILTKADREGWAGMPRATVSELVAKEVSLQAMLTGIDSLWIKSTMMRIQDGRL